MQSRPKLVVGTRNRKKGEELFEILRDLDIEIRDLTDWLDLPEVIEDGTTFEENACKKATTLAEAVHQWVLAEDSGLVAPALNGQPGVYSARYAGTHGDDAANNARLLLELSERAGDKRSAYYVCFVALAGPEGKIQATAEGRCYGVICRELRG